MIGVEGGREGGRKVEEVTLTGLVNGGGRRE